MAKAKKYVENVVNEEKVSETPSVLVSKSPDQEYHEGGTSELSPNPAGSGFTKQKFVDSLPLSGEANVLYLVPRKVNGGIVGYTNWKWDIEKGEFKRVYGSTPNLTLENGGHGTLAHESNTPRENPEKVYNGQVVFNGNTSFGKAPTVEGKPLQEWLDSKGGVTEEELNTAIQGVKNQIPSESTIKGYAKAEVESAESGTIQNVLGLDSNGDLVKNNSLNIASLKANEIIENMTGYVGANVIGSEPISISSPYLGCVKNGNKLTIVLAGAFTITDTITSGMKSIATITIPSSIGDKLFPAYGSTTLSRVDVQAIGLGAANVTVGTSIQKTTNTLLTLLLGSLDNLTVNTNYCIRMEATFLLSDNLL